MPVDAVEVPVDVAEMPVDAVETLVAAAEVPVFVLLLRPLLIVAGLSESVRSHWT